MSDTCLPPLPQGYSLVDAGEIIERGDLWSYESTLGTHGWLPTAYVGALMPANNRYCRKTTEAVS
jgi:hypothetical protein